MSHPQTLASNINLPTVRLNTLQRLSRGLYASAAFLFVIIFSQRIHAGVSIDQLRQEYQEARATFAKTEDYGKDYTESIAPAHALMSALLNHLVALPDRSEEVSAVCREIRTVFKDAAGNRLTEK